jgi:hypothetical protein
MSKGVVRCLFFFPNVVVPLVQMLKSVVGCLFFPKGIASLVQKKMYRALKNKKQTKIKNGEESGDSKVHGVWQRWEEKKS